MTLYAPFEWVDGNSADKGVTVQAVVLLHRIGGVGGKFVIAKSAVQASSGFVLSVILTIGGAALAQPTLPSTSPPPAAATGNDWTFDIGPGVLWAPKFEGSRDRHVVVIPAAELRFRQDRFFVSVREGIGATLFTANGFRVGPILRLNFGRGEDNVYLSGLGSVPVTVEGGAFAKYDINQYAGARIEFRRGLGGHNGWLVDLGADGRLRLGQVGLSLGPRLSIADGRYNQAFFGVDQQQALRSGYARYEPGFGVRSVGASASALWSITDKVTAVAIFSYGRLLGPAGESPIVNGPGGQRDQITIGSAVTYRFAW